MTRRQSPAPAPEPIDPGDELISGPEEVDIYDEITRLAAETGGGGARKVVVKKKRPDGSGWERCRQFTIQELDRLDPCGYFIRAVDDRHLIIAGPTSENVWASQNPQRSISRAAPSWPSRGSSSLNPNPPEPT